MTSVGKKGGTAKKAKNQAVDVTDTPEAAKAACEFCHQPDLKGQNEIDKAGRMFKFMGKFYHYFCILFSYGVTQTAEDVGLKGFTQAEIQKVLKTGATKKCCHCSKKGATSLCTKCKGKKFYHYTCGVQNDAMFIYHGAMGSFCKQHRPKQKIKAKVKDKVCLAGCLEKIKDNDVKVMVTPCCFRRYHTDCVQLQALASGSHHFKCCMCSDKKEFAKVAASMGIYIPVQDATWELEEGFYGFQEQGQLYSKCDAPKCLCPKGRKHTLNGTYFELIRCEQCGSSAVHIKCAGLLKKAPFYVCDDHENAKEQMDKHKADIKNNPDYSSESEPEAEMTEVVGKPAKTPKKKSPRKKAPTITQAEGTPNSSSESPKKAPVKRGRKKKLLVPAKKGRKRKVDGAPAKQANDAGTEPGVVCLSSSSDEESLWETDVNTFLKSESDSMKKANKSGPRRPLSRPESPINMTPAALAADLVSCLMDPEATDKRRNARRNPDGTRARIFALLHPENHRLRIPLQPPPPPVSVNPAKPPALPAQPPVKSTKPAAPPAGPVSENSRTKLPTAPSRRPSPAKDQQRAWVNPAKIAPKTPCDLNNGLQRKAKVNGEAAAATLRPGPATLITFTRNSTATTPSSAVASVANGTNQTPLIGHSSSILPNSHAPGIVPTKTWDMPASAVIQSQPAASYGGPQIVQSGFAQPQTLMANSQIPPPAPSGPAGVRRTSFYGEMTPFGSQPNPAMLSPAASSAPTIPQTGPNLPTIGASFSLMREIPTVVEVGPNGAPVAFNRGLVIGQDSDGMPVYHQPGPGDAQLQERPEGGALPPGVEEEEETMFVMGGIVDDEVHRGEPDGVIDHSAYVPRGANEGEIICLD